MWFSAVRGVPVTRLACVLGLVVVGLSAAQGVSGQSAPAAGGQGPTAANSGSRADFLARFARGYFPGRTGQILVVPREGDILTRPDPNVPYMHGSPWAYDSRIPMMFAGRGVTPGVYNAPAVQQDVAVTIASALGVSMPPTSTGHVLPGVRAAAQTPRAVLLIVLDGMRADYFQRYASAMPTLTALRKKSAWFANARVNYLPTNTGAGHASIATGSEPRAHGITETTSTTASRASVTTCSTAGIHATSAH